MPPPDIFELLEKEHRELLVLLSTIISDCRDEKEIAHSRLLAIQQLLTQHADIEETLIYPQAEQVRRITNITESAFQEHGEFMYRLQSLHEYNDLEVLEEKCQALVELLRRHLDQEEYTLFPALRASWGQETLDLLGKQMHTLLNPQ